MRVEWDSPVGPPFSVPAVARSFKGEPTWTTNCSGSSRSSPLSPGSACSQARGRAAGVGKTTVDTRRRKDPAFAQRVEEALPPNRQALIDRTKRPGPESPPRAMAYGLFQALAETSNVTSRRFARTFPRHGPPARREDHSPANGSPRCTKATTTSRWSCSATCAIRSRRERWTSPRHWPAGGAPRDGRAPPRADRGGGRASECAARRRVLRRPGQRRLAHEALTREAADDDDADRRADELLSPQRAEERRGAWRRARPERAQAAAVLGLWAHGPAAPRRAPGTPG